MLNTARYLGLPIIATSLLLLAFTPSSSSAAEVTAGSYPVSFTTSDSASSTLETVKGEKIVCKAASGSGEIASATSGKATNTFTGCEAFGLKCNSAGASSGEIVLSTSIEPVEIDGLKEEIGLIFSLGGELAVECSTLEKLKIKGKLLCAITPVAESTESATVVCKATKGVQEPTEDENEIGEKIKAPIAETKGEGLVNFAFEQSGLTSTNSVKFAAPVSVGGTNFLLPVSSEISIGLMKGEENNAVLVNFSNTAKHDIEVGKKPVLGGDLVSWSENAMQEANVCKKGLLLIPAGTCSVKMTFKATNKAKKVGKGMGYIATVTESTKGGNGIATATLNGEVTN
jgi:hypothetical protein